MKINEVDPRNFDSDIDYYAALNAKPKARTPGEPRLSPAQQDAEDEDSISQQRQAQHKAFTQKRAVKYVDQEGSAPNGEKYNKLYVIQAQDAGTADHEEYMFDKHEWGAKKVVDVKKEKNADGSVTHTLFIVDNHKYGMWKPWKNQPAENTKQTNVKEFAPVGRNPWGDDDSGEDPYKRPEPKHYSRSIDFFGKFEADHFDQEDMNDATGEFKGYWDYDGKLKQIAYFKFDKPNQAGSDDPGMGWYYEPNEDSGAGASATPAVDTSAQRKQQELNMIDTFLKSGQTAKPGSQIHSLMKKHGMAEGIAEASPRVDSLVTDALKIMRGAELSDAVSALKTVLGDREYNGRRGHYNFYVRQLMDMYNQQGVAEGTDNPTDVICVDVPLFIRLMEYAREDASTDMDLHDVAERLIQLSAQGDTVSMSSYDEIVGSQKEIKEADMDLEQGRKNILSILKAAEQGQDAEIMVGGEPITLEYPEARFVGGRYKSFMKAGRQEEFLRALTDARAFDRIMTKMRAVIDKQKNFRGSVPGERGVEEGSGLDRYRQRVQSQGFTVSPDERNTRRQEYDDASHQSQLNRMSASDQRYAAWLQHQTDVDAHRLGRMQKDDDDWEKTFDMMRDRMNRYQWSSQRDVDPEQLAAISNIKYEPRKKTEAVQAKTDDKLRAYYAQRKAEAEKKKKEQGLEEGIVDTIKSGAKKAFDKLGGGSDEELLQRLEKETGGKRPEKKDNEKVKESAPPGFDQDLEKKLLKQYKDNPERAYATMWTIHNKQKNESHDRALVNASAQLKENEYFCMLDKRVKQIPEGYKRTSTGYIIRK